MLLRYIVSNFKSIGHPVEFSMFPTEESTDERFLKTITTKAGEWKVLRRGGFFFGQDTLKAYLSGRFGAVPMIKGLY